MPRLLSDELRSQLDHLPREGAHILTPDEQPTWAYDPQFFVAHLRDRLGLDPGGNRNKHSDAAFQRIAAACGWKDPSYLTRKLGLRPYRSGDGRERYTEAINYDSAVKLARALKLDPQAVGV
jgi:hypothetical protein